MGDKRKLRERPRDHERNTRSQTGKSSSSTKPQYDETIRRPSWDKEVREAIFEEARDQNNLYKCAITGGFYPRSEMQIDHIVNWETYCLQNADPNDADQMYAAYNNRRNLRLIHGGVNASKGKRSRPGRNYLSSMPT
jgi:hypothetical protein